MTTEAAEQKHETGLVVITPVKDVINTELKKFSVTDKAIENMRIRANELSIGGVDDKAGYDKVHEARMIVRKKRIDSSKFAKERADEYKSIPQAILTEGERIATELEKIEATLKAKTDAVDMEKERIKQEKAKARVAKMQDRTKQILIMTTFDGETYRLNHLSITNHQIDVFPDANFNEFLKELQSEHEKETARQAELKRQKDEKERADQEARKKEDERLAKLKEEQDAEAKRLDQLRADLAKQQEEINRKAAEIEANQKAASPGPGSLGHGVNEDVPAGPTNTTTNTVVIDKPHNGLVSDHDKAEFEKFLALMGRIPYPRNITHPAMTDLLTMVKMNIDIQILELKNFSNTL